MDRVTNLGAPVAVDVAAVEQELSALWKAASEREGEGAVIRACSCNLVVLTRDREEAESLLAVLGQVSEWHPCRSLIAFREPDAEGFEHSSLPHMHAWISAQCALPFAGGPQVCSEVVTVAAHRSATADLLNTLVALLVPDLPVILYWRSFRVEDLAPVEQMAGLAHLLIVDSHATKDDPVSRQRLLELLLEPPHRVAVRDLNWARLNAWRDLVAQFFDNPALREEAYQISEVEVERDIAAPGNIPTRTLLLTGWLASRLGWSLRSAERRGDQWISFWKSRSGDVVVRSSGHLSAPDEEPGISLIRLRTRTGATFQLVRAQSSTHILATESGRGPDLVHSVPQVSMDEATLLVHELSLSGQDTPFQSALAQAVQLERSFK